MSILVMLHTLCQFLKWHILCQFLRWHIMCQFLKWHLVSILKMTYLVSILKMTYLVSIFKMTYLLSILKVTYLVSIIKMPSCVSSCHIQTLASVLNTSHSLCQLWVFHMCRPLHFHPPFLISLTTDALEYDKKGLSGEMVSVHVSYWEEVKIKWK